MDILAGLNPQQIEAVTLPHQSALVLAGAGSGKTRVLTSRIACLIQKQGVSPHEILAVTFTNKAAREMMARILAMIPINLRGMWIGTFHGLCNRMLRAHHKDAGLPETFQIMDSADQLAMVKRVIKSLGLDDEKYPPKQMQHFINNQKEQGLRPHDVPAYDMFTRAQYEIFSAYENQCNREGVVDFAELLLRSYELLSRNEILRTHYRKRFRHILVDEFQDTNRLQYRWLKLLAGEDCAVFAVGDDDQSIYAFRGADTGNMRELERDFHIRNIIKLEQNYRSHGNILDAANALIQHNTSRLGKNLWTSDAGGEKLRFYQAPTDLLEAEYIIDEIRSLHEQGVNLNDIALLYRSNAQSRVLEHALFNAALPYRVYGGLRFFERQEIKHALAYLRLVHNPDDDGALLRVINFPARGIGAKTVESLQLESEGKSLWAVAKGKGKKVEEFIRLIETMQTECGGAPLAAMVETVIERSGLKSHYLLEKDGEDRLENLGELVNAAAIFESEENPLVDFLSHAALEAGERQSGEGSDAIQLMTVHSAKGLEFHAVFLSGLEEGLFPHSNSRNEAGGIEEERRLMYVAITRARRRLYLSCAQSRMLHGQTNYNIPSRFLNEIPPELIQPVGAHSFSETKFRIEEKRSPWKIGANVFHPKFGEGVVLACEGSDQIQVNFRRAGMKWLALEYANLIAI
ncbi:MAG: UvrD-helicase domain-containing protein [Burkholderiales bacterium]|nr:UvrD-helicase domain-containing protein [Burkholderiales bacterium]